jgi:hypothetical protein
VWDVGLGLRVWARVEGVGLRFGVQGSRSRVWG